MAESVINSPKLKTQFISSTATTSANKIGSTGMYIAGFDIVALTGISSNRIRGFLPKYFGDVTYSDWVVYMGLRGRTVGIGSTNPQQNVRLEGYVLYE